LAWDTDHPSSIFNCIQSCRENARSVRGAMTVEMWECINDTWLELLARKKKNKQLTTPLIPGFLNGSNNAHICSGA